MVFSGVIFDLNGTILSDEDEYGEAFNKVLRDLGAKPKAKFPHISGIGVRENWPLLLIHYKIKTSKTIDELAVETQMAYLKLLPKISLNVGFIDFINRIRGEGVKTALATSNSSTLVERIFHKFNIGKLFDTVVTREEINESKPSPEIFLKASDKLGLSAHECLVIEDAKSGIEAAHAAGMKVIALARDKAHAKTLKDSDEVIFSFKELLKNGLEH